jgi:hypothetical protein
LSLSLRLAAGSDAEGDPDGPDSSEDAGSSSGDDAEDGQEERAARRKQARKRGGQAGGGKGARGKAAAGGGGGASLPRLVSASLVGRTFEALLRAVTCALWVTARGQACWQLGLVARDLAVKGEWRAPTRAGKAGLSFPNSRPSMPYCRPGRNPAPSRPYLP